MESLELKSTIGGAPHLARTSGLCTAAVRSHWLEQSPPPGEMWPRPERGSGSRGERQLGPSMKYAPRAAGWNSALSWPARPPSPAAWFWLPACRDFMQGQPAQGEAWLINPPVCPSQRALGRRVLWIECWCLPQISYVESLTFKVLVFGGGARGR